jgi:hypothetical protein
MGVPLAVLGPATGPYDDPKAWALPILVGGTALAWLLAQLRAPAGSRPARACGTRVLGWIVAAYGAWWVLTTIVSIAPGQSLLGNFGRGLGLAAVGSAVLLFPLVRAECRTAPAVRILIDAALLGSAPVCALALGQALGWDPLPRAWDPAVATLTVRSTFGQHIFLGSYLVALIPLAVARIEWALGEWRDGALAPRRGGGRRLAELAAAAAWVAGAVALVGAAAWVPAAWWLLVPWGVAGGVAWSWRAGAGRPARADALDIALLATLLLAQLAVVVLAQARGAFLGMLVGLGVTDFAFLARRRARRTLAAASAALAGVALLIALLNVPGAPVGPLRSAPLLNRLSDIANVRVGTPSWFRVQVWRGVGDGWRRQLAGEELIPGAPRMRSAVGYGLETQLVTLDRLALPWLGVLRVRIEDWHAQYLVDRAHNIALEHLVTGGLVAVALWALLVAALAARGIAAIRAAATPGERAVRIGALGTVAAHVAESQVGIVTPMPLALFWIAAALLTGPPWTAAEPIGAPPAPRRRARWIAATATATAVVLVVAWLETAWLLASVAYADGTRHGMASQFGPAYERFARARQLAPWLALPSEALAYTALRMAAVEPDPPRRARLLAEAEAVLADERRRGGAGGTYWTLSAQVAFAQARGGDRSKLSASLDAFEQATRLRPADGQLLAQRAWALLESGDAARARALAEQAVGLGRGDRLWLAWAVLARSARALGDGASAEHAAARARRAAPAEAQPLIRELLS